MARNSDWTSIAVQKDTHDKLEEMKTVKSPGKIENFDDVIRRKTGMPTISEER